jgi:hypothetical protein
MLVTELLQRRWVTMKQVVVYAAILMALTISVWLIPSTKSQLAVFSPREADSHFD